MAKLNGHLWKIFDERHKKGQIYRKASDGARVLPVREVDADHPLHYVYPDGEQITSRPKKRNLFNRALDAVVGRKDNKGPTAWNKDLIGEIKNDEVFAEESVSVTRDRSRILNFEATQIGARFLDKQIDLQRTNAFIHARDYRKDNIIDHVDPLTHKPRHGSTISIESAKNLIAMPGEFAYIPQNIGRLQGETVDNLISSFGPVYYRLNSREGMLNAELTILKMGAAKVRQLGAGFINKKLAFLNRPIQQARVRLTGAATVKDRPEIEYKYLEQLWEANKAVEAANKVQKYGQIYLGLSSQDDSGTYTTRFGSSSGFKGYVSLKISDQSLKNMSGVRWLDKLRSFDASETFDKIQSKVSKKLGGWVTGGIRGISNKLGYEISDKTINAIKGIGGQFLPKAHDIHILRTLRRFTVDIDDIIDRVNTEVGSVLGMFNDPNDPPKAADLYDLYQKSKSSTPRGPAKEIEIGAKIGTNSEYIRKYIDQIKRYKGTKPLSIGINPEGGATSPTDYGKMGFTGPRQGHGDDDTVWEVNPREKRYYKDYMQINRAKAGSIFREPDDPMDSDSIDVIFQVLNDEEVRFRAFIEDIGETVTPTYTENKYIGRYETFYTYDKVIRNASFQLRLQAFSIEEREHIMEKMAYLTSLAYPESSNNYLTPLVTNLTIGKVYIKQPCILQGLSHSIESDTSWDIDYQTPMSIVCSLEVRLLDKEVYTYQNMKGADFPFSLYLKADAGIATATKRANAVNNEILGTMEAPDLSLDLPDLSPDFSEEVPYVEPPSIPSPSDSLPITSRADSATQKLARRRRDAAALRSTNSLSRSSHRYHFGG